MHGDYRDLNTKYKRSQIDLKDAQALARETQAELKEKIEENTSLNQQIVDSKSRSNVYIEKVSSLQRELGIKST